MKTVLGTVGSIVGSVFCFILGSIFVLGAFATAQTSANQISGNLAPMPNTVFVGADGKFETAPDTAVIQFNISAQANTAKDAYEQAAKQAEATREWHRSAGGGDWIF
jgi:uncharacterized protein YggE